MPVAIGRKTIPIADIVITERQRKTYDESHIKGLAESIRAIGLINPITLEEGTNKLVAGFSRIQAYLHLGLEEIDYLYQSELDDITRLRMELEENLQRKDLEWWEKDAALANIHTLMQEIKGHDSEPDQQWSMRDTASLTQKGFGTVQRAIEVVDAIKLNPELKNEKTRHSAMQKMKTKKQLEERKSAIEKKNAGKVPTVPAEIIVGDARELIKLEPDAEYDAVITNFPFGIDYKLKGGEQLYHDEENYITDLVRDVVKESFRVLKDNSWMVCWFDVRKITYSNHQKKLYEQVLDVGGFLGDEYFTREEYTEFKEDAERAMGLAWWLQQAGFSYVTLVPPVWVKPNKTQGMIGDPRKGFIVGYEAMLFAAKGDAMLMKQGLNNLFIYDTLNPSERDFGMQMPLDLTTRVVELVVMGGGRVLDPFAGSGSIGEGALNKFCSFKGFELDPERAEIGNLRLREHIFSRPKEAPAS